MGAEEQDVELIAERRGKRPAGAWVWIGLALLGLALRVAHVLSMRENPHFEHPIMDARFHVEWADAMVAGREFLPGPLFRAPLYVLFLAAVRAVFGEDWLAPRLLQALFGAATTALTYHVAAQAFDRARAVLAGLAAASYWVLIYFDGELLIPTLIVPLDLAAILLCLRLRDDRSAGRAFGAGLLWGLSAIARPNVLLFLPLLALWLALGRRLRALAAFALGVALPIAPVTAYNWVKGGELVLISSQGGVNFWIGNNPSSDGSTAIVPGTRGGWWEGYWDAIALAEAEQGSELGAAEVSRHYARKAWAFLLGDPARSLPLLWHKLALFWKDWELGNNEEVRFFCWRFSPVARYSPLGFGVLAPLGLLGFLLALRRWRELFPLWGFLPVYTASVVAFFVTSRFRVPVLPVLMIFGAHAALWSWERLRRREWRRLALALAFLLLVGSWVRRLPAGLRTDDSNGLLQLGTACFEQGRPEEAEQALRQALQANPANAVAAVVLARVLDAQGRTRLALPVLEEAWARDPRVVDSLKLLMGFQVRLERWGDVQRLARQVSWRGGIVESIAEYHLGLIELARGAPEGALQRFRRSRELDPNSFDARYMLAFSEQTLGRHTAAAEGYRQALELRRIGERPFVEQAFARLVELLVQTRDEDRARRWAREWSAWDPQSQAAREALRALGE